MGNLFPNPSAYNSVDFGRAVPDLLSLVQVGKGGYVSCAYFP